METPAVDREMLDEIVIGWEDEYTLLLADIKARMLKEAATDQEAEQVNNLERIVLVYDLMMKRIIERQGNWPHGGHSGQAADNRKKLFDRVRGEMNADPQLIRDTLNHACNAGHLTWQDADGKIRWQWADFI